MPMCDACPFNCTEVSAMAYNYGCLPTTQEIMMLKRDTGKNWPCHDDETRVCSGFASMAKQEGVEIKGAEIGSYKRWFHGGAEAF